MRTREERERRNPSRDKDILDAIAALELCTLGQLSRAIGRDKSNLSRRVKGLIGDGLVMRDEHGLLYLSNQGGYEFLRLWSWEPEPAPLSVSEPAWGDC